MVDTPKTSWTIWKKKILHRVDLIRNRQWRGCRDFSSCWRRIHISISRMGRSMLRKIALQMILFFDISFITYHPIAHTSKFDDTIFTHPIRIRIEKIQLKNYFFRFIILSASFIDGRLIQETKINTFIFYLFSHWNYWIDLIHCRDVLLLTNERPCLLTVAVNKRHNLKMKNRRNEGMLALACDVQ